MSNGNKLRGGEQSTMPLARLKQLPVEEREWAYSLRNQVNAATGAVYTNSECRGEIRERLSISLGSDSAYSDFCSWQFRQRQWDVLADIQELDEQTLRDRFPNLSRDKIRDAVIKRQYAVAELQDDPKFTLAVIKVDQAESSGRTKAELDQARLKLQEVSLAHDERRLKLLEQKAAQADEAQKVVESPLTPEQKQAKLREIFGMS